MTTSSSGRKTEIELKLYAKLISCTREYSFQVYIEIEKQSYSCVTAFKKCVCTSAALFSPETSFSRWTTTFNGLTTVTERNMQHKVGESRQGTIVGQTRIVIQLTSSYVTASNSSRQICYAIKLPGKLCLICKFI